MEISIHRPHTRPDSLVSASLVSSIQFQFTGLIRGPTPRPFSMQYISSISIHRPHTRPDGFFYADRPLPFLFQFTGLIRGPTIYMRAAISTTWYFNSQASYEARLLLQWPYCGYPEFQFTGLIRGPTLIVFNFY